ncbi:MAG: sulfurtransferase [Reichenbachiella sp.]
MDEFITPLIQVGELIQILSDQDLIILDTSIAKVGSGSKSPLDDVKIKGSRLFNLAEFSKPGSTLPNTFPSPEHFQAQARKLGINNQSKIIIYDNLGIYSSPRVWWMFKTMGHDKVTVLNGGLKSWQDHGYDTESKSTTTNYKLGDFISQLDHAAIKSIGDILSNISSKDSLVIDARSSDRFDGSHPEPRQGLRCGHIPNSMNIPYDDLLEDGFFKSPEDLQEIFNKYKDEPSIIFSCGSGVTACILLLASEIINLSFEKYIFDGSWTEWGLSNHPITIK